ncbi:MAG: sugar phosphate isomerase/epimerase [Clostridia bacterium]|nr:sugar phosphate isomerase/epimerase [Clostridia bacterium]
MQISFRTHDLKVRGLDAALSKMKECEVKAVQLVPYKFLDEVPYKPGALNEKNAKWLGDALREAGVDVTMVGAYFNPVHSDKKKVSDCVRIFKDYLTYCQLLGKDMVGSETGSFNDDKWTYNPKNRTDEALDTVIETFSSLAAFAEERGVKVGMEGAAGHVCFSPERLKEAVDAIGKSNVRVIFDIYNYLDDENHESYLDIMDEGLEIFKGKVDVFHVKDWTVADGKIKQVAVGKGRADMKAILSRIKAYDEDAKIVLEGTAGDDIVPSSKLVKKIWDEI